MRWKQLAFIACGGMALIAASAASHAMEQNIQVRNAEGVQLRRVAVQDSGILVYDYKTDAGVSRLSIDPTSLVNDLERARKRAVQKKASVKSVSAPAVAAPRKQASLSKADTTQAEIGKANVAKAEIAKVDVATPAAPVSEKKVRVIQLYNLPKAD